MQLHGFEGDIAGWLWFGFLELGTTLHLNAGALLQWLGGVTLGGEGT